MVTTDPQHPTQAETEDQNGRASAAPPETKSGAKKSASTHNAPSKKSSTTGTAQAALVEERRKTAEAQAALKDMQRRLDAIEATLAEERKKADEAQQRLAEERRKTDEAQQALAQQRQATESRTEPPGHAEEEMPGEEAAFGIMPYVGFRGTDFFDISQKLALQAIQQPPLLMKNYSNFMLEMGRVMTGQSTVEAEAKDKRFTDEVWKTNPFYRAYLQTYLTWE